ncbi:unnamed protein product [Paramecium primaurelia]|uniref:Ankyrin repeat protein n=1 Tax=Paramecium primaurelia TaxID=5886 RepID=A0A8S1QLL5_PARPR|nr:unnamed protein product [Paramecium primaurelia]
MKFTLSGPEELIKQIKEGIFNFNPLEILGIEQSKDARASFINKITSKKITKRIAVTLAFDQISTKQSNRYLEVYQKKGYYKLNMQKYGVYEAALISDIEYLKQNLKNAKNQQQEHKRTLLYTCCRSGFYDCVELLLHYGCDIEQQQDTNSTPLHVASFYGHKNVTQLLISYGANNNIKNHYNNIPSDEARTDEIKQLIISNKDDNILTFFQQSKKEGIVEFIERSKNDNMIRIYRKLKKNKKEYCHCYHGTKFKYIKPILDVGLQPSGAKTKYGKVETPSNHIHPDETIGGIKNWAKAIFTSPSAFYAADTAYSERIQNKGHQYCCLVEALIKEGSYKQFPSTVLKRVFQIKNEPADVEYRIDCNQDAPLIQRTEDATKVIVFSALFLKEQYLQNQENYDECNQFLDNLSAFEL